MSTISGPGGLGTTLPIIPGDGTIPVAPETTTTSTTTSTPTPGPGTPPPLFQNRFSGIGNALALGLADPRRNAGDIEAVFAEIAAKLRETQATTNDNAAVAQSESRRSDITRAGALLAKLEALGVVIDSNRENIRTQEARITVIDGQLAPLREQRSSLEAQKASLEAQQAALPGQINTLNGQISTLQGTLPGLINQANAALVAFSSATTDEARNAALSQYITAINQYNANVMTINTLTGQRDGLQNQLNSVNSQLNTVNAQLATVRAQITDLENQRQDATNSINASVGRINAALVEMISTFFAMLSLITQSMLGVQGEEAEARGATRANDDSFEKTLLGTLSQINRDLEERVELRFMEEGAILGLGLPATEQQRGATATRFGSVSPAQSLALGFAAVVASLNGALSSLLADGVPQNAGAMAQAGASRTRLAI